MKYRQSEAVRQYLQPWEVPAAGRLREASTAPPPSELEMQALWFEGLFLPSMTTEAGEAVEILDPGQWNHGPGPDFQHAILRRADGTVATGPVELHLAPRDWARHGHRDDPAYDPTLLHVVWRLESPRYYPATAAFRALPQVELSRHLPAPWPELRPHALACLQARERPRAQPGPCSAELAKFEPAALLSVVRAAGRLRLQRKAQRLAWRASVAGQRQALWEALAEGLGYHANTRPMRMLARRLPVAKLERARPETRLALAFGLAGMLPHGDLARLPPDAREWARPVWDAWWRARGRYAHAVLRPEQWRLAGLRPWNRPERRLALLPRLASATRGLLQAVRARDAKRFARTLQQLDSGPPGFWHRHASLTGKAFAEPRALLGPERVGDLVINVFWPLVAMDDPDLAAEGWQQTPMAPNQITKTARQRVLEGRSLGKAGSEALTLQGLMQIYRDYCCAVPAGCPSCRFPEMLRRLRQ
ncbi:MAG: DUF2851 family protein [Verrucomicrobiota bacterium]